MTILSSITSEVEVQIETPAFYEYGHGFYKITEQSSIKVDAREEHIAVEICTPHVCYTANVIEKGRVITQQQFDAAFNTALLRMNKHI